MMTFEQFFLKKKIDIIALQATNADLLSEFKAHYAQMGEKSFDHTKKYWFNQLRLSHKLSEEDELKLKEELNPVKEIAPQQEADRDLVTETPIIKAPGFKPRFKATIATNTPVDTVLEPVPVVEVSKPSTGFKPRFKAAVTIVKPEELGTAKPVEEIVTEIKKPAGFKPRFKAGNTPTKQENKEE
jgi:hypothetical protein